MPRSASGPGFGLRLSSAVGGLKIQGCTSLAFRASGFRLGLKL